MFDLKVTNESQVYILMFDLKLTKGSQVYILMFDLIVEVSREPVVEPGGLHVARSDRLLHEPVQVSVRINLHRKVTHLGHKREPKTFQKPAIRNRNYKSIGYEKNQ